MCSSFRQLRVESRDLSHAEKERTPCKAEQIHKLTTIFTQNYNLEGEQKLSTLGQMSK